MAPPTDTTGAREGAGPFVSRLHARVEALDTRVCLHLVARPERHPSTHPRAHEGDPAKVARAVVVRLRERMDAAAAHLACVSLASATFERLGIPGLIAMAQLIADARERGVPCILDAQRGGAGEAAAAYADAYLGDGVFAADALTVHPWAGVAPLEPFLTAAERSDRGVFVVVRSSGPGAGDLQDLRTDVGTVAERLADLLTDRARDLGVDARGYGPLGATVAAADEAQLAALRARLPHSPLLVTGLERAGEASGGAADGAAPDIARAAAAFDADGFGALVRTELGGDGDDDARGDDVGTAAQELSERLNASIARR